MTGPAHEQAGTHIDLLLLCILPSRFLLRCRKASYYEVQCSQIDNKRDKEALHPSIIPGPKTLHLRLEGSPPHPHLCLQHHSSCVGARTWALDDDRSSLAVAGYSRVRPQIAANIMTGECVLRNLNYLL